MATDTGGEEGRRGFGDGDHDDDDAKLRTAGGRRGCKGALAAAGVAVPSAKDGGEVPQRLRCRGRHGPTGVVLLGGVTMGEARADGGDKMHAEVARAQRGPSLCQSPAAICPHTACGAFAAPNAEEVVPSEAVVPSAPLPWWRRWWWCC